MELIAAGTLIGAKVAAAGAAVGTKLATFATSTLWPALTSKAGLALTGLAVAGTSALSTTMAGNAQRYGAETQAKQTEVQMEAERLQATIENEERQRQLRSVLATQNAIFGGAGIDVGSGTPVDMAQASFNSAMRQQRTADLFSTVRQGTLDMQREDLLTAGRMAQRQSRLRAGASLIQFAGNQALTGRVPGGSQVSVGSNPFGTGPLSGGEIYTGGIA